MKFIDNGPDIPNTLLQAHEEGRVVFFCGAGISYPAGLPGFKDLVDSIYSRCNTQRKEPEEEAYKRWQYDTTLNLLEERLPGERFKVRTALAEALTPNLEKKGATTTHAALLELARSRDGAVRLVTTNFDRIFNHVISRGQLSVTEYSAPCLPIPKNSRWNGLVYLHGLLPKEIEEHALNQLIITSGDFGLAYLTERWAARFVSDLFQNFIVCFVGYSINDPVLRYLMDALAADRRLGEIIPQAYAFGSYDPGQEHAQKIEWDLKGVTPILYPAPHHDHSALHRTLDLWAQTYCDGVQGKERIVVDLALTKPSASTRQDDYVGRMIWALSDPSGKPAERFATLDPAPSLDWLEALSQNCFTHTDLSQFGISDRQKLDEQLKFSLLCHPTPHHLAPKMMLTNDVESRWDNLMAKFAHWLLRHLNNPQLLLWLTEQQGGRLHSSFIRMAEWKLQEVTKLEREGNAAELDRIRISSPDGIPTPPMRKLWGLLLAGRIQQSYADCNHDQDLYSWKEKLEREGLNFRLRCELRELLAPKIRLKKSLGALWGEEKPTEITNENIKKFIDWDIVLTGNDIYDSLHYIQELESWPIVLPELLCDLQQLLKDALDLQRELGEARDLDDPSNWVLPSITPHAQNSHFQEWVSLVELLRDAWLAVCQSDSHHATKIARNWFEQPYPTFKRLALFAANQDPNISSDEWVSWLLADGSWWLWTRCTLREVMRLLVLQGKFLSLTAQKHLEASILAGPPRKIDGEDLEAEKLQDFQEHSIWLRLAKLQSSGCKLNSDADRKLKELAANNPTWKLATNESDEFLIWSSGTGDPDFEERHPVERVPRQLDELVTWLGKNLNADCSDPFHPSDWRDVCKEKFAMVFRALCRLSEKNIWPANHWQVALQVWSEKKRILHCWRYVAPLVAKMPDEVLKSLQHPATYWLQSISEQNLNCHKYTFFSLCDRYLDLDFEEQNDVDPNSDLLFHAINHPIGHITRALINIWFLRQPNDNDGLPDDIKPRFTKLCQDRKTQYRHGRVVLASKIIALFRVDQQWTEENLLPFFNWQNSELEAKSMWAGFLWSPRIYWPLMTAFKDHFLEAAQYFDHERGIFRSQYLPLLVFAALDPNSVFSPEEYQVPIASLSPRGLQIVAGTLTNALKGAGEQKKQYWQNHIQPFWQKIWPKEKQKMSALLSEPLARLCIAAGDEFPNAFRAIIDWLQPIDPHYILHLLSQSNLCSKFPQDALDLLVRIIGENFWSHHDLKKCLDDIATVCPDAKTDGRYRKLSEYL